MLPGVASIVSYGGAKNDYSAPRDATTDRAAAGTNPAYSDIAAMTKTGTRVWARFQPAGSSAPALASTNPHNEMWNNGLNAAPAVARSTTGEYTLTFPATVFDEIPAGVDGATPAGFTVNLMAAWANAELGSTTNYDVKAAVTAANVITVQIFTVGTSTHVDPNDGTIIGVFST